MVFLNYSAELWGLSQVEANMGWSKKKQLSLHVPVIQIQHCFDEIYNILMGAAEHSLMMSSNCLHLIYLKTCPRMYYYIIGNNVLCQL